MNKIIPFMLVLFFTIGSFIPAFSPVSASELVENSWNTKTSMSQARSGLGVVTVDGKIYAIGGSIDMDNWDNYVGTNERYDPKTDAWVTLEPMPTPRHYFAIVAYEDKIFCIGGGTNDFQLAYPLVWAGLNVNEVYDIATDSWSTKAPLPVKDAFIQAYVVDGKIFVMTTWSLYVYDPINDFWTNKTDVPSLSTHMFSVMVDDKIIVVDLQKIMVYDIKNDVWSEGQKSSEYPIDISPAAVVAGATTGVYAPKKIYAIGVRYADRDLKDFRKLPYNWVYDHVKDTWSTAKAPSIDVSGCDVAVVDDLLYVIGGAINEQYTPIDYSSTAYTTPTPSNSTITSEPTPTSVQDSSTHPLTYLIVAILATIVGIVVSIVVWRKRRVSSFARLQVK